MTSKPTFDHPVFEKLYERDYHLDDAVLREILALGPAAAVPELLKITDAVLTGFDYDDSENNWTQSFHFLHALYLLHELEAPEAFDVYRRLLKEDPENLEYWFGDWLGEEVPQMLAVAARPRPTELMALLEDGTYSLHNRQIMSVALLRLAERDAALRPDIVEFLRRYLRYLIDHSAQASLLFPPDADFYGYEFDTYLGFLLTEIQDAGLQELDPEIRQLHRLGMVDESIAGGEADITYERGFQPAAFADIFARYQRMREHPEDSSPYNPDAKAIAERQAQAETERQERLLEYYQQGVPPQPRLAEHKIGRNDPCYCGSGKKYKKCCME